MKKLILGAAVLATMATACSKKDDKVNDPPPIVQEKDSLTVYKDLEFAISADDDTRGIAFSSKEGKIYTRKNLPADGKLIDLVFADVDPALLFFASPDDKTNLTSVSITNATSTLIQNYVAVEVYDAAKFDTLSHGSALNNLVSKHANDAFPATYKGVVLFKNAAGKTGVIKISAINAQRILATIKVQP